MRTLALVLLSLFLWSEACADPQCPPDYIMQDGRCKRCPPSTEWRKGECIERDGGTATINESGVAAAGTSATEAGASLMDANTMAAGSVLGGLGGSSVAAGNVLDGSIIHAGSVLDASTMPAGSVLDASTAGLDAFFPSSDGSVMPPPTDADGGTASTDAMTPANPCLPNPCRNGSSCAPAASSYSCTCAGAHAGTNCEVVLETCGNTTVRSRADVDNNRFCSEIQGNLDISALALPAITADDFPYLKKITGQLQISGVHTAQGSTNLRTITLSKLEIVEGPIAVVSTVIGGAGSGPVDELHLPVLATAGRGIAMAQSSLRVLELPALTTVGEGFSLYAMPELCTLNLRKLTSVGGQVMVTLVPRLSVGALDTLRSAATGSPMFSEVGCCWQSTNDWASCQAFIPGCAGCRRP